VGTKTFTLPAGTAMDKAGNSSLKITKSYSVIKKTEEPEIPDTETTGAVYPQQWATGTGTIGDPWAGDCINDAYTAATAGDTIYLRAGYYTLASTLTIQGKMVNLVGDGRGKTFIVTSMNHSAAMIVYDDYTTLKGFTLDADSQVEEGNRYAIKLLNGDYMTVEDIEVKNAGYAGIEYADIDYAMIKNIYLHDNAWHGMHSAHATTTQGRHNIFQNIQTWNHTHYGFDDGLPGTLDCDNIYDNIQAWHCGKDGINIWGMVGGNISNCSAWDCNGFGINICFAKGLNIHDSSFNLNNSIGMYLHKSSNVLLDNVIMKNNNVSDSAGIAAVYVEDSDGIKFSSCQFYDDRDVPLQDYGICIQGIVSLEVINCILSPNEIAEIYNPAGEAVAVITEKMLAKF
jgi:hypothetical protein